MDPTKDNLLSFQDSKTRDVLRVKMAAGVKLIIVNKYRYLSDYVK